MWWPLRSAVGATLVCAGLLVVAAFIAVVLGGLGNLTGAVVGGYVLGFADQILAAVHSNTILQFHDAVVLAILIGILLLRPQGLVGRREGLA